ncbi:hypothetical protein BJ085DRAFT_28318 [Dimargaris cristalligena]|uniref:Uncharacterized protein n=1 Tax=Dimargaris cristalligena TaxID=215637 RepID=A0A4V1J4J0_9FUNG|nr:hypothetical protein BJ085DRAFT_28318 [Dimargaris cristalligena]|eukprot:RKP35729.1 hypothetical protein BJ085DRAFT_28318 [Dimargaris cristalligena]
MTTPNPAPISSNSMNLPSFTTRELATVTLGHADKEATASLPILKAISNRPDLPDNYTNVAHPYWWSRAIIRVHVYWPPPAAALGLAEAKSVIAEGEYCTSKLYQQLELLENFKSQ